MTALALAALVALGSAVSVPELTGPVVDEAGLLSRGERRRLEALSEAAVVLRDDRLRAQYARNLVD